MKDFSVKVPGIDFELESNKTYRIGGRVDSASPDGWKEQGISKFQHPLNSEGAIVRFDAERNVWDTGLYKSSPCYARYPQLGEENQKIFEEFLLEDLKLTMPDDAFSPKANNKYWDEYSFPINQPLTIRTSTPQNFLGMWFALLHYTVAPKEKENFPIYREMRTGYTVVDIKEKSSNKQKSEFEKSKATSKFVNLLESDKKSDKVFLEKLMDYVGFKGNIETEAGILNSQFNYWINNKKESHKNASYFNQTFERFSTEEGREELEIYNNLKDCMKTGSVTFNRSEYYLGEESLGNNLKEADKVVNSDKNL